MSRQDDLHVARVTEAAKPVMADLAATGKVTRALRLTAASQHPEWSDESVDSGVVVDYGGHSFVVDAADSTAGITREIADRIQEDVIDDSASAWPLGATRAEPMTAGLSSAGEAVWLDAGREFSPIGSLRGP